MAKRKCKVCGCVFEKQRPLQFVCSPACGIEYQREQKRKAAVKSEQEARRKERAKTAALRHKLETVPELGRNEKLVMRHLADLSDEGLVVCERLRELRCMKMRYWGFRSVQVRYYRLATAEDTRDVWAGNVWMRRWSDDAEAGKVC